MYRLVRPLPPAIAQGRLSSHLSGTLRLFSTSRRAEQRCVLKPIFSNPLALATSHEHLQSKVICKSCFSSSSALFGNEKRDAERDIVSKEPGQKDCHRPIPNKDEPEPIRSAFVEMLIAEETKRMDIPEAASDKELSNGFEFSEDLVHLLKGKPLDPELSMPMPAESSVDVEQANAFDSEDETGDKGYDVEFSDDDYEEVMMLDTPQRTRTKLQTRSGLYGTPNPDLPISDIPCGGCGALLHCQDSEVPGFMPSENFKLLGRANPKKIACQRCTLMHKYNVALNLAVDPAEYDKIIKKIKHEQALVLAVVDIMDLPNSIFKNLPELIGKKRPLYVVGNKVDLLPRDAKGYLNRAKAMLQQMCEEYGLTTSNYVKHTALISAKTGYGVEDLITRLMRDWARGGHVYVVGCTNVGKSTLFNTLLSSDYCKSFARDFIHRATVSVWPGTTLDVLRFPIVDPAPWRLVHRARRLRHERAPEVEERMLGQSKHKDKATLIGHVGQSFLGSKASIIEERGLTGYTGSTYTYDYSVGVPGGTTRSLKDLHKELREEAGPYDESLYTNSRWCHDTPGVVNPDQIINILTQEELSVVLPKRVLVPRSFVVKPGQTLFVSGLGRIDYIKGNTSIYFTVLAGRKVRVHVTSTTHADDFYRENIGTKRFSLPLGDKERLQKLPSLVGKQFVVHGIGWEESMADVLLSSIGWVAMTAGHGMEIHLRAYTPGARGLHLRHPSLLPFAINLRGRRVGKSAAYKLRRRKPREE